MSAAPLVIAHRGASGELPENTLEAFARAHALGADFSELDVVLARDGTLVVTHDTHVDDITDVAQKFPGRARADGRHYVVDFDWPELLRLRTRHRYAHRTADPAHPFRLPTLDEVLELVARLNLGTGRTMGLYIELKSPAWHAAHRRDLAGAVVERIRHHGLDTPDASVVLESFDPVCVRRLHAEFGVRARLTQLIGENHWREADCDYDALRSPAGLREIATYAHAIAPPVARVVESSLVAAAHAAGLRVHSYTFRTDATPAGIENPTTHLRTLLDAGVDGLFTDHVDFVKRQLLRV